MRNRLFLLYCGIIIVFGLFLPVSQLPAWEQDRLASLSYLYVPGADVKSMNGEMDINAIEAQGALPIPLRGKTFLVVGIYYQGLFVDYQNIAFTYVTPEGKVLTDKYLPRHLQAIDLVTGINLDWGKGWRTYIEFRPGIHSDRSEITSDDIYYQGGVLASHVFTNIFTLIAGAYHTNIFGQPEILPAVGVQWRIGEKFTLDTILPKYLVFTWNLTDRFALGLKGWVTGNQFHLSDFTPWEDTVLEYSQILVGPFIEVTPMKPLVFRVEGGIATYQKFRFSDGDSSSKYSDGDLGDSAYFAVSGILQY